MEDRTKRFWWGEFTPCFGLQLGVGSTNKETPVDRASFFFNFIFGSFFIKLWKGSAFKSVNEPWVSYKISYDNGSRSIHFSWGEKYKIFDLPWSWVHQEHTVRNRMGEFTPYVSEIDGEDERVIEKHPYTHVCKDGRIQKAEATIFVEKRIWKWKWFQWLPFPKSAKTNIDVWFSNPIGEREGVHWKGGTLGCGYDMKKGETPRQTLMRMEKERKF